MKMMMSSILLLIACSSAPAERKVTLGESFQMQPGEAVVIAGTKLKFLAVESDSRCPEGVQCIWEGSALLRFAVGDDAREVTLDTSKRSVAIGPGSQLVFEALDPQPVEGKEIGQSSYRARLRLEPLETS